jgi:pimeloyl-ACP methyl ester carboxylesterase
MKPVVDTHVTHQPIHANGVDTHFAGAGTGPLVLLVHGFPSCGISWRAHLPVLSGAGVLCGGARLARLQAIPRDQTHRNRFLDTCFPDSRRNLARPSKGEAQDV